MRITKDKIESFVQSGLAVLFVVVALYVFLKFAFPVFLPFVIAYVISAVIRPLCGFLCQKTKISEKVWAAVLIVLVAVIVGGVLCFFITTLAKEARGVLDAVSEGLSDTSGPIGRMTDKVQVVIKTLGEGKAGSLFDIREMVKGALQSLSAGVASRIGDMVSGAPSFFFFVAVMILSLFYFSCDLEKIKKSMSGFVSERIIDISFEKASVVMRSLGRFAKAYLLLLVITFLALSVGFWLIGIKYPLFFALLTSLVDILPVFGVGTVLVPWGIGLFLVGETGKGIWMLLLFLIMYAFRQILEPKLIGDAAGVHPLFALFAVFLGFRLLGVGGMILAPLALNAFCVFWEEKKKKTNK